MFRIFDGDGNGNITLEELNQIVYHLYHLLPEKDKALVGTPEKVRNAPDVSIEP